MGGADFTEGGWENVDVELFAWFQDPWGQHEL